MSAHESLKDGKMKTIAYDLKRNAIGDRDALMFNADGSVVFTFSTLRRGPRRSRTGCPRRRETST
jgi:hypothetical protein